MQRTVLQESHLPAISIRLHKWVLLCSGSELVWHFRRFFHR
ncbi:hypothetical protein Hanom_Chr02g00108011 [Helianthus anomalus]